MSVKVTKIKKGIVTGTPVPAKQHGGNIGHWVESELQANGYEINKGKGLDMPKVSIEVKSRKDESNSAHTIGSMTTDDIKTNSWYQSSLHAKCQRQYRVNYSDNDSVVTGARVHDFSDDFIQEKFQEAYEAGRHLIINDYKGQYARASQWGYFERQTDNSWLFRIPHAAMKKFIRASMNSKSFGQLFDYGDQTLS
jgi:hypothetical protein